MLEKLVGSRISWFIDVHGILGICFTCLTCGDVFDMQNTAMKKETQECGF